MVTQETLDESWDFMIDGMESLLHACSNKGIEPGAAACHLVYLATVYARHRGYEEMTLKKVFECSLTFSDKQLKKTKAASNDLKH